MFLTNSNTLEAVLTSAVITTGPDVMVSFADLDAAAYTPNVTLSTLSNSPVTILAAPAGSVVRQVKGINIHNSDSITHVVTVTQTTGAILVNFSLAAGQTLFWTYENGWKLLESVGGGNPFNQDLNTTNDVEFANIDSTPIGGTTPATATVTTLEATGIINAAAAGIYLGTAASANLLDDYEEGTFTPVIADASSGGNTGGGSYVGWYERVGRVCTVHIKALDMTTVGLTAGNNAHIQGLPFTIINVSAFYQVGTLQTSRITFAGHISVRGVTNNTSLTFFESISNAAGDHITVSQLLSGSADAYITMSYLINNG